MYSVTKMIVLLFPALFASWNSTVLAMSPATMSMSQNANEMTNLRQGVQESQIRRTPSSLDSKNQLIKPQVLKFMVAVVVMVSVAYFVVRCVRSFSKTKSLRRLAEGGEDGACGGTGTGNPGGAAGGADESDIEESDGEDGGSYIHTSEDDTPEDREFEKKEHACRDMHTELSMVEGDLDKCSSYEAEHLKDKLKERMATLEGEEKEAAEMLDAALTHAWITLLKKDIAAVAEDPELDDETKEALNAESAEQIAELEKLQIKEFTEEQRTKWIETQKGKIKEAEDELEKMRKEMADAHAEKKRKERKDKKEKADDDEDEEEETLEAAAKLTLGDDAQ